jgi:hypothetical protein
MGIHFDLLGWISDLNGASADEYSPEPVQYPQTWRRDNLSCLDTNEASGYRNSYDYDQPNHERPTGRHYFQEQAIGKHFDLLFVIDC